MIKLQFVTLKCINMNFLHVVVYFVSFGSGPIGGREGSSSSVTLTVSQPAPFDITLTLQSTDGSATCEY